MRFLISRPADPVRGPARGFPRCLRLVCLPSIVHWRFGIGVVLAVAAGLLLGQPAIEIAHAQLDDAGMRRAARATVLIAAEVTRLEQGFPIGEYRPPVPLGSGVLVSPAGHVITAGHVLEQLSVLEDWLANEEVTKGFDLRIEDELLIYVVAGLGDEPDPAYRAVIAPIALASNPDLAVLTIVSDDDGYDIGGSIAANGLPLQMAASRVLRGAEHVQIFGYPVFGDAAAADIVSQSIDFAEGRVRRVSPPAPRQPVSFQIDVTVSGGSSGGAVVDDNGQLVGIVSDVLPGSGGGVVTQAVAIGPILAALASAGWVVPPAAPSPTAVPAAPSATSVPPTATATSVPTLAPTATPLPQPTAEPTLMPTPVPTRSPVSDSMGVPMFRANSARTGEMPGPRFIGSPTIRWSFETNAQVRSSPAVVRNVLYIGSLDGSVYALDARNGDLLWDFATGDVVASSPAVSGGLVYIGSRDGNLYAIDARDGTSRWVFRAGNAVHSSPAVVGGSVYFGSNDHHVYAVNAANGRQRWTFPTGDRVSSSPAVVAGVVYVGSDDNNLYAIDAQSGQEVWRFTTEDNIGSSPAVVDGVVYVGSDDGNLYAIDATTGDERWRFATGDKVVSSPAVVGDVVYVGSNVNPDPDPEAIGGSVFAVNAQSGDLLWEFLADRDVESSPAVSDGVIYVGSRDGNVYAIDGADGRLLWDFSFGNAVHSSPAVVMGTVYVGSEDGIVYAMAGS
jgi:eukaryotic-like serine/threonine-protein kinase